ncbi:MAG: hypothetical protein HY796_12065 [Elusimicrobia bacterium]|nr:hypothetical protein [Elusimicrobiota bacterium]
MAATGCSASCKSGTGFWGFYTNWRHNSAGETANCGSKCFNPETKCCLSDKTIGAKCGIDAVCYNPRKECCVNGKKQKDCKCQHIEDRIQEVKGLLAIYNAGRKPAGNSVSYAYTTCTSMAGYIHYNPLFYELDSALQEGVIAHETKHKEQCETGGWLKWFLQTRLGLESSREIPAYEMEKKVLENKYKELCK